jgi:hypothetical protein
VEQLKGPDRPGRPIYSISAVARMVGVPVSTLRTWEERYKLVVPERNASGHRLYSRDQVEQLEFVKTSMATASARPMLTGCWPSGPMAPSSALSRTPDCSSSSQTAIRIPPGTRSTSCGRKASRSR